MKYARLYADKGGESHFEDVAIELDPADFAPAAPPVGLSDMTPAEHVGFLAFPVGWVGGFHAAPARMILFVLGGEVELGTSDGSARRFTTGSVVAVEDTNGKGHAIRVVGGAELHLAFAGLADLDP